MSNLMAMFYTGVSGVYAAQAKLDVTGHNIANIDNENYSRQRVNVASASVSVAQNGTFGRGVKIVEVIRVYDDILARTLRNENSSLEYWTSAQTVMNQTKVYFNELESNNGSGLGEYMRAYFDAWQDLATTAPDSTDDSLIRRTELTETATTLSYKIKEYRQMFTQVQDDIDERLKGYVSDINTMAKNVAELNDGIMRVEASGENANDLRDAREAILNSMAKLYNVNAVERPAGDMAVFIGGNSIVDGKDTFPLEARYTEEGRMNIFWSTGEWYDKGTDITARITGGAIQGELEMRDEVITGYIGELDDLARNLIQETNKLHISGQGLSRFSQLQSSNHVENPGYPIASQPGVLPYDVQSGTFQIKIYDNEGKLVDKYDITIDPNEDTLYGIAEKISHADGDLTAGHVQAQANRDGTLRISVTTGYTFAFGEDTSNFLMAAGFNNFFSGTDASNIDVDKHVKDNPEFVAAGLSGAPGDNQNAELIANVKFTKIGSTELTIDEFYGYFAGRMASDKEQVDIFRASKEMTVNQYKEKLQSIKGVSMEEEQTNLAMFQRVLEANSRFINAVDELLDLIVNRLGLVGR